MTRKHSASDEERSPYEIIYVNAVVDFMIQNIWSERVYEKVDSYRHLLAEFPDLGTPYDPEYPAARPPFPCRRLPIPDTPFTLYYYKDDDQRQVAIFYIEHQGHNPESRFEWACMRY